MAKTNIKVLGPGCINCKTLLETTNIAVSDTGSRGGH